MARSLYPQCPWATIAENRETYIDPSFSEIFMPQDSLEHIFNCVSTDGYSDNITNLAIQSKQLASRIRWWVDEGRSQSHNLTTNFEDVRKSQFHSFIAFIKLYFESLKVKINNYNGSTWGASAKKFHCVFSFNFPGNSFNFQIDKSESVVQDGVKIEEVIDVSSFSGQIIYDFFVNSASFGNMDEDLKQKIIQTHEELLKVTSQTLEEE